MSFNRETRQLRPIEPLPPVGSEVFVTAGRYVGARGVLVSVGEVETPSGAVATIAIVRRPRAGDTVVFATDLMRAPNAVDELPL